MYMRKFGQNLEISNAEIWTKEHKNWWGRG